MSTSFHQAAPRSEATVRFETLIERYPALDEREIDELIELSPRIKMIDRSLMTADARLSGKLAAFERDHRRQLRTPVLELVGLLAFPLLAVAFAMAWMLV
nr:hypothetical protein [Sphingomonas sp. Y57]